MVPLLPALPAAWSASLDLVFERREGRSVLRRRLHHGPLRVQKLLYPEGAAPAHLLIVHPPGGVAGGDRLSIRAALGADAQVLMTTPGAGKWYKANGRVASQALRFDLGERAALEWLPQENIVFDGAQARWNQELHCHGSARACGWELVALGRRASGERFASGALAQRLRLYRDGELLFSERGGVEGGDALLSSPLGWDGAHVSGMFWALGLPQDESLIAACRTVRAEGVRCGVTWLPNGLLLARVLGHSPERLRSVLAALWACLRPALFGHAATPPRIWAT